MLRKLCKRIIALFLALILTIVQIDWTIGRNKVFAASNEQIIFNYITGEMGYNTAVAVGFLANIYRESSFNPQATNGYAYGIIQWEASRLDDLKSFCSNNGYDYTDLYAQLHFLKHELSTTEKSAASKIANIPNTAEGAETAGYNICYYYERPANKEWKSNDRASLAKNTYWPEYSDADYDPNAPSNIYITGYDGPQEGDVLEVGANCGLYGTIISTHPLSKVWGGVYNRDGSKVGDYCFCSESTSVTSYSLRGTFNNSIIFDYLPEGFYTFKIEATDSKGYSKVVVSKNFQVGNLTVSYTVTLNPNGGSVSPTSITVSANGTYSGLTNPSKTGYTFTGWYTSDGTKKENGSGIASNSNHTLTARWTPNKYKIAFNANGGSGSMSDQTLTYDTASTLTANAFTRTGYSFTGWNTKSDGSGTAYSNKASVKNLTTSGTVTLYAQWSAGGYTIAYNSNGGTGSLEPQNVKYDQTVTLRTNTFTRTGYTFAGWNTKSDGSGTSYADKASVKNLATGGTVTLYARWTANKYTVKFEGNGADELSLASKEVTYNSTYGELPQPKRDGYNFIGWYTAKEGGTAISPDTKVTITSTQTLYAQWSQVKFLITFNTTGGTSESVQKLVTYDKAYGVLPTAERTGYTFKGWYLDEACTQQITSDTIVALTANQSVYAKWEIRKYVITFDATGGTTERDSKQVTYGKAYGVLPTATKDGDEFIGWFTEDGIEITSASIVEIESNTTLYAKWASDEVIGDVNADGVFNVADVVMMQKWLLCAGGLTDWQAGDLCRDERIDVFDLCLMKRMLIER